MRKYLSLLFLFLLPALSCQEDNKDLPPVEERVSEAKASLINELTAPEHGWRVYYQPTPFSGTFLMLLTFDDEGMVRIKSDLARNDGEFYDQTLPYRIDNILGLELIFETYGVFHYLFEIDANTFGAEFEFVYKRKEEETLIFESKTDAVDPTVLTLEPASANDESLLSRQLSENLESFALTMPDMLVQVEPSQQLILDNQDISVFWSVNTAIRTIRAHFVAEGATLEDIITNNNLSTISYESGFSIADGKIVLNSPLSFQYGGNNINFQEITLSDFGMTGPALCPSNPMASPEYKGNIAGIGPVSLVASYFASSGFVADVYSVNIPFVFDENDSSLSETGSIADNFPDASGFLFVNDVELVNDSIPKKSVGIILENGEIVVREFESTQTANLIQMTLVDSVYISGGSYPDGEQKITDVTNDIFEGGYIYSFDFPQANVFRLFNPCNGYEIFLVR